ncbi:hypothetical protein [Petrotoga sp. HWHPT.55.6.3]|jgi:hypothetical protein|nr:hypothetical protein [Petrotoga sp. HWHPT.55.6.3]PNR92956.1 hypothetical protein X926_04985 [Petrotoga sp. HWHPT.55.6.3]
MEFLELPNKGSVTPLCCGDDGNCEPCYPDGSCHNPVCGCQAGCQGVCV